MTLFVLDDILANPDEYVQDVLKNPFVDVEDGDEVEKFVLLPFPDYTVKYNFIRQSPFKQIEPNYIHTDEMMGDKTVLVYLNKYYPPNAGTVLYDKDEDKSVRIYMKYNRLVVFDSREKHSRNLYNNFAEKNNSRLVQVLFLKK